MNIYFKFHSFIGIDFKTVLFSLFSILHNSEKLLFESFPRF